MWLQFSLQILPVMILGGVILWMAIMFTPPFESPAIMLITTALAILLFGALLTFREQVNWNLALLLGFAAALGAAFSQLAGELTKFAGFKLFGIIIFCLVLGGGIGRRIGNRFEELGVILWLVSWAYLLGWGALIFLRLDPIFYLTWSLVGLLLFTGLAAVWFSHMERYLREYSGVSAAIDIYLVSVNLVIAGLILLSVQL